MTTPWEGCYRWVTVVSAVREALPRETRLTLWQAPIFANEPFQPNWREFRKQRGSLMPVLEPPASLPPVTLNLDAGELPDLETFTQLVSEADSHGLHPQVFAFLPWLVFSPFCLLCCCRK